MRKLQLQLVACSAEWDSLTLQLVVAWTEVGHKVLGTAAAYFVLDDRFRAAGATPKTLYTCADLSAPQSAQPTGSGKERERQVPNEEGVWSEEGWAEAEEEDDWTYRRRRRRRRRTTSGSEHEECEW